MTFWWFCGNLSFYLRQLSLKANSNYTIRMRKVVEVGKIKLTSQGSEVLRKKEKERSWKDKERDVEMEKDINVDLGDLGDLGDLCLPVFILILILWLHRLIHRLRLINIHRLHHHHLSCVWILNHHGLGLYCYWLHKYL